MESNALTNKDYWENDWKNKINQSSLTEIEDDNLIKKWIENFVPLAYSDKSCLEIGCFPGKFLSIFGKLGFTLNGIDLVEDVESKTKVELEKKGFKTGIIQKIDFFDFAHHIKQTFDLVSSFGFVEHFINYEEVIHLHIKLVKKNGLLIIETPNFRSPIHYLIKLILDRESLRKHNVKSMNLKKWEKILISNNFEIIYLNGIGPFQFWLNNYKHNFFQAIFRKLLNRSKHFLNKHLPINNKLTSSIIGVIAKKL